MTKLDCYTKTTAILKNQQKPAPSVYLIVANFRLSIFFCSRGRGESNGRSFPSRVRPPPPLRRQRPRRLRPPTPPWKSASSSIHASPRSIPLSPARFDVRRASPTLSRTRIGGEDGGEGRASDHHRLSPGSGELRARLLWRNPDMRELSQPSPGAGVVPWPNPEAGVLVGAATRRSPVEKEMTASIQGRRQGGAGAGELHRPNPEAGATARASATTIVWSLVRAAEGRERRAARMEARAAGGRRRGRGE